MSDYTLPRLHPADLAALIDGVSESLITAMRDMSDAPGIDGYYTVEETAALLKVHRATLKRWELADKLIPVRLGSVVRYRKADVQALRETSAA